MKMELTKEQQQLVVAAVLGLGAFGYCYYAFFWAPLSEKIASTREEIEKIEKDLATAKKVAGTLESIKSRITELNQQMEEAEKRLPKKKEVANIVETLHDLGKQQRVNLLSITPGPTASQPLFVEVPYAITMEGTYHSVARFLAALAISERIFHERGLSINVKTDSAGYTVASNFTLVAYLYREAGAQGAQGAQKGQPAKK